MQPKINLIVLLFSLAVGLIFVLPFFLAPRFLGSDDLVFTGISSGEVGVYTAQIRRVFEGKFFVSDAQLVEYANHPPVFQLLGATLLGNIAKILGDFNLIFIFEAFILGFLIFTVGFYFMYSLTSSISWSAFGAVTLISAYPIFIKLTPYSFEKFSQLISNLLLLGKLPVNPVTQLPFNSLYTLFQLTALFLLHKSLITKRNLYIILAGIFAGLLFYTTLYYWSIYFAGFLILLAITLLKKDKFVIKTLIKIFFLAAFVSIPFWLIYLKNFNLDAFLTFGSFNKRYFEAVFTFRYLIFGLLFFLISKVRTIEKEYLAISFALAGIICLNIQLILGLTVLPNHWPARLELILLFFASYFVWLFLKNFQKFKLIRFFWEHRNFLAILGTVILFSYLIAYQIKFTKTGMMDFFLPGKLAQIYSWMNKNTPNSSVVLGLDTNYIYNLTANTHNRLFMSYAGFSFAPLSEQIERIGIAYSLLSVSKTQLAGEFEKTGWTGAHFNFLYDFHKYYYFGDSSLYPAEIWQKIQKTDPVKSWYVRYLPEADRQKILESYERNSQQSLSPKLARFKLDYILIGPYERSLNVGISNLSERVIKVFDNGDYLLYQVVKMN